MRHANEERHAFRLSHARQLAAGVLFQHVVDHLKPVNGAGTHRLNALVHPADLGPQRNAVRAQLAFFLQPLQRLKERVVVDGVHLGVVGLPKIDPIRLEPAQALFHAETDEFGPPVLRAFLLAPALLVLVPVVAAFGGNHQLVAHVAQRLGHDLFAKAIAIGVGCIEKRHAEVVGAAQQIQPDLLVGDAPPGRAHGPHPKAELRDLHVGGAELYITHLCHPSLDPPLDRPSTVSQR